MIVFKKYNISSIDFENHIVEFINKKRNDGIFVKYNDKKFKKYFAYVSVKNKCKMILIESKIFKIKFFLFIFYDKWNSFIVEEAHNKC